VVLITEAFYIRSVLAYCHRRRDRGGGLLSRSHSVRPGDTLKFDGIVRRHLEIMTGAGIVAGLDLLDDRGPIRRRLARPALAAPRHCPASRRG
jgi:hypothetical protein